MLEGIPGFPRGRSEPSVDQDDIYIDGDELVPFASVYHRAACVLFSLSLLQVTLALAWWCMSCGLGFAQSSASGCCLQDTQEGVFTQCLYG